jgi:hypothetical protein
LNRLRRTQASTAHTTGVAGSGVLGAGARNGVRRLVTTPFRNPTSPVAGVATRAVGTADAATVRAVSALLAVLVVNACAVGTARDSVSVADGCAAVATTLTAPTEVAGVVALTVAECVEFDSVLAGVDVGCSVSGAGVAGGVLT